MTQSSARHHSGRHNGNGMVLIAAAALWALATATLATAQPASPPNQPAAGPSVSAPPFPKPPAADTSSAGKVAPYVPSAGAVVDQMLDLADVGPGDYLIDLGSGDGQIVIAAAKRGAFGHGVDLDGELVELAASNARDAGIEDSTTFLQKDMFETDFSHASVVTLYLMPAANARLRPLLLEQLRPGTRVVSNAFDMNEWRSDDYQVGSAGSGIYLWIIPERIAGNWSFAIDGQPWAMAVQQEFQAISPVLQRDGQRLTLDKATLRGQRLQLLASDGEQTYTFWGHATGDRIEGYVQIDGNGNTPALATWTATRQPGR